MGVLHFRYRERRRTLRVALAVPVLVHGHNDMGEKFCLKAMTRQSAGRSAGDGGERGDGADVPAGE
jgi:hypothetical protein